MGAAEIESHVKKSLEERLLPLVENSKPGMGVIYGISKAMGNDSTVMVLNLSLEEEGASRLVGHLEEAKAKGLPVIVEDIDCGSMDVADVTEVLCGYLAQGVKVAATHKKGVSSENLGRVSWISGSTPAEETRLSGAMRNRARK